MNFTIFSSIGSLLIPVADESGRIPADHRTRLNILGDHAVHADHRMRAMYAWHAMEEMEHKAVAFDVLQQIGRAHV